MRSRLYRLGSMLGFGVWTAGCGMSDCPTVSATALGHLPPVLSKSGLFDDAGATTTLADRTIAAGVQAYTPRFELWADGAHKRRWLSLPEGTQIDTSDMNDWRFPEGTKLWKEFSRDGKALETRLMYKAGPTDDDWAMGAYVWNDARTEATLQIEGSEDVLGTSHDVPSGRACFACHGGTKGRVLGVSAVQLSAPTSGAVRASAEPASGAVAGSELDLASLAAAGRLSHLPVRPIELPGSDLDQRALGYLHANCGSCHSQARPPAGEHRCYDPRRELDLTLRVEQLGSVTETGAYRTGLGKSLIPSDPDDSSLVSRCDRRFYRHMPPLATEEVDTAGVELLRRWIASLPAQN